MTRITALFLTTLALVSAIACGAGGASSPTGPSASSGPFNGTWSGTFGASPGTPITFTLTQTGNAVTGFNAIVCSGCGDGRSNVGGTASGNVATVAFTHPGDATPYLTGATLTISGSSMATQWRGDAGTITGNLTSGAAPPVATTPPPTTTPPAASNYAVTQVPTTCTQTARSDTRYGFTIIQAGTVTGASNAFLDLSEVFLGISGTTLSCNSWSYSDGTCRRLGSQPETTSWSVTIVTPLGYREPGNWTVQASVRSSTGTLQATSSVGVTCVGR